MRPIEFRHEGAWAQVELLADGLATLKNLRSQDKGKGQAKALMEKVCVWADENGVQLLLMVQPYGDRDILTNEQLEAFYGRFGFERQTEFRRPIRMSRLPSQNLHTL